MAATPAVMLLMILAGFHGSAMGITLKGTAMSLTSDLATSGSTAQRMSQYLRQRELAHEASLSQMKHNMTLAHAASILRSNKMQVPMVLLQTADGVLQSVSQPQSGVDKAKTLLNTMLEEVAKQYDTEVDRCCDFAEVQHILLEETKQDIAYFGAVAAESREHILAAQKEIDVAETNIPIQTNELAQHQKECEKNIKQIEEELKIILADIQVISMVLRLTDCKPKKTLLLLSCDCDGEEVFAFDDDDLHQATSGLASKTAQQLLQEGFRDMSNSGMEEGEFDGIEADEEEDSRNSTKPIPQEEPAAVRTITRRSPCKAPGVADKRASKCSVRNNPKCHELQERFLLIQTDIMDKKDEMTELLAKTQKTCDETTEAYEAELKALELHLKDHQTKLASATEELNTANEQSRVKGGMFEKFKGEWEKQTTTCQANYLNLESQECGLKKIRAELFKMQSKTKTAFFQDCVVSAWEPGECSKSCEGGQMVMSRSIVAPPKDGMKCLPLAKTKTCNTFSCPIHCKMDDWEGWSSCSAECGGGLMERNRKVNVRPRYNGLPCDASTEAITCNSFACDADCKLNDWTMWSDCSSMCGGGSRKRIKTIKTMATGSGKCPAKTDKKREEYMECNTHPCLSKLSTLRCESSLDIVLLIDGSGSVGKRGWEASKKVSVALAKAFNPHQGEIQMSTILYSGPRTWSGVRKCTGGTPPMDWTEMFAKGSFGNVNPGKAKFNELFQASHLGILKRECMWCRRTHKNIYFRWSGDKKDFDAWDGLMVTWRDKGFKSDFNLYSSLSDALRGTRAWQFCNGNDPNIGFPRDCGRRYGRGHQWSSLTRGGQRSIRWSALAQKEVDIESVCKIKVVDHFTNDTEKLVKNIEAMEWPRGSTLTSLALQTAQEELPLSGRPDVQSVVLVLTDGRPLSNRKTMIAARNLRKVARLMFVPVTRYAPIKQIKRWVTRRWQENLVSVNSFRDLAKPEVVNQIVKNVCPSNS